MSDEKPFDKVIKKLTGGEEATITLIGDTTRWDCGCFDAYDYVAGIYERVRCERHAGRVPN